MPVFEYKCTDCSTKFEELIRSQDDIDSTVCPQCESIRVVKQMSMFGFSSLSNNESKSTNSNSSSCSNCVSKNCATCR